MTPPKRGLVTTVYAVERGQYSDYEVGPLFSTRELAESYIAMFDQWSEMRVVEYELDPVDMTRHVREGHKSFCVRMTKTGDVVELKTDAVPWADYGTIETYGDSLAMHIFARDKEHATKIANERRIEWLVKRERGA